MNEEMDYSFCKPYITAGEQILWRGAPGKGNLFTKQDIFMIPFSILWCGFAIFWEASVLTVDAPILFKLWGIPFVCVGLYMVFGRFFWTAYQRKNTVYVITNQKVIRKRGNRIDIQALANAPATHLEIHKDGFGTLIFGNPYHYSNRSRNNSFNGYDHLFSMENIPDAVRVQQIIINARSRYT